MTLPHASGRKLVEKSLGQSAAKTDLNPMMKNLEMFLKKAEVSLTTRLKVMRTIWMKRRLKLLDSAIAVAAFLVKHMPHTH